MADQKFCIYCGALLSPGSAKCPSCGKVQQEKDNLLKDYLWEHTKDKIKGEIDDSLFEIIKNWLFSHLYGVILLLTVVGTLTYVFSNRPPVRTAWTEIDERPETQTELAPAMSEAQMEHLKDVVYVTVNAYENAVFYWTIEDDPDADWGPNGYQHEIPPRPEELHLPSEYGVGRHEYSFIKGPDNFQYTIDKENMVYNEPTTELGKSLLEKGFNVAEVVMNDLKIITNADGSKYAGPGDYLFVLAEIDGTWYVAEDIIM